MSPIRIAKDLAKSALFKSGAVGLYRRVLLANTLTVVMFHRVLATSDARFPTADPSYTMRLEIFEQCLHAMAQAYNVVSLAEVEAAAGDGKQLPKRALLITFDDGWKDTAQYAAPALRKHALPAAVFVASSAIANELTLWSDVAACIWRALNEREHNTPEQLISKLEMMSAPERERWLKAALDEKASAIRPLMMSQGDVRNLPAQGVAVGAHGATHTPLTKVGDIDAELDRCKNEMHELTGTPTRTLAFPHGCYSPSVVAAATRAGYVLQFTSDPYLNALHDGRPSSNLFGRIDMPEHALLGKQNQFDPQRLAYWLTSRAIRKSAASTPAA